MKPTLRVTTESGAVYEFSKGLKRVRRVPPPDAPLRKDNHWIECVESHICIGASMGLVLQGVAPVGDTVRTTTPVVSIEGVQ